MTSITNIKGPKVSIMAIKTEMLKKYPKIVNPNLTQTTKKERKDTKEEGRIIFYLKNS